MALDSVRYIDGTLRLGGTENNIKKTIGMVYHPFRLAGVWADKVYTRRMKGVGGVYKEKHQERVNYPEFRKDLLSGSLAAHLQTQHGVAKGEPG